MRKFKSEARLKKITKVLSSRQFDLQLVLEEIHDPHNVSAILRTCDAVGVQNVSLIYNVNKFPRISRISSASAKKWVDIKRFDSVEECFDFFRKQNYKIFATALNANSESIYQTDFTEKVVIVLGNEHTGVSEHAMKYADSCIYIPMNGMVQSLNVSVAAAVILYEAYRQRQTKGLYDKPQIDEVSLDKLINQWCEK